MKLKYISCLSIIFSIIFISSLAHSTTYYVSPAGSDNYAGTRKNPFKTIQKAADIINPGDTVIVQDGIYRVYDNDPEHHWSAIVKLQKGGTAGKWITFKSMNKNGAILDGQNNKTTHGWLIYPNVSYVKIEDFVIKGFKSAGFYSNSGCHDISLVGNEIYDIGRECTETPYGIVGVFQEAGTSNHIYDGNIFHDIGRLPHGHYSDKSWDHALYIGGGSNGQIINNSFYNMNAGWPIQFYAGKSYSDIDNWEISNNIFAYPNRYKVGHIIITGKCRNILINNNTSYSPLYAFVYLYNLSWPGGNNIEVSNNKIYGVSKLVYNEGGNGAFYEYNNKIDINTLISPEVMNQTMLKSKQ